MPDITIQFSYPINQSCQEGDLLYYTPVESGTTGGFIINQENTEMIEMGPVKTITEFENSGIVEVVCAMYNNVQQPASQVDFIFFGKDRGVNEASIVGYYGKFVFKNNSKQKAELFTTACEVTESSK